MPVQILGKHEISPGAGLKEVLEAGEKAGQELHSIVQFNDETAVIWKPKPRRETRATEKRG